MLKYRISPKTAKAFIKSFIDNGVVEVIYTDKDLELKALKILKENIGRKGFSYTDAITVVVLREFKVNYLLTHDLRSFTGLVDSIIGPGYWQTIPDSEKKQILRLVRRYHSYRG